MSVPSVRRSCPDEGTCHHDCATGCFRVTTCGPLSGVYPNDRWPEEIVHAHAEVTFAPDRDPTEAAFDHLVIDGTSRGRGYGKTSNPIGPFFNTQDWSTVPSTPPVLPCACGEPESPGVAHRLKEPCHVDLTTEAGES